MKSLTTLTLILVALLCIAQATDLQKSGFLNDKMRSQLSKVTDQDQRKALMFG